MLFMLFVYQTQEALCYSLPSDAMYCMHAINWVLKKRLPHVALHTVWHFLYEKFNHEKQNWALNNVTLTHIGGYQDQQGIRGTDDVYTRILQNMSVWKIEQKRL